MDSVSDQFIDALTRSQKRVTTCTYTIPGGIPKTVKVEGGSVSMDSSSNIRRRATINAYIPASDYESITLDGTRFVVEHGIIVGSEIETVALITGELNSGSQQLGGNSAGTMTLPLVDLGEWVTRAEFIDPYSPPNNFTRAQAISAIVGAAIPTALISNTATDIGIVAADAIYTGNRWNAIQALCADGGLEAFFDPYGVFIIRDQPKVTAPWIWTVSGIVGLERVRPTDRLFNTVVVSPGSTDGSQTWTRQIVSITDPAHPRHPSKIGYVPYRINSTSIRTAAEAYNAGVARLQRVLGTTETLNISSVFNPALEGGDPIRVISPRVGNAPPQSFSHIVDGFQFNLETGLGSLSTRNQEVDLTA